ncbi:MAG TPA: DUF1036 domain-containing protein [Gemmobacter sp.]|nr:DUF1036 domain-containing protein [Gemmobacter sp.]
MRRRQKGVGASVLAAVALWPGLAAAQFQVCNQTLDLANVAIGQPGSEGFETRGWWKIGPNQCATVIRKPLTSRYLYVFATDVFGKELLSGAVPMCIGTERFVIEGAADCALRGLVEARFIEVDTGQTDDWTLFLKATP